jgi:hypothetical protein
MRHGFVANFDLKGFLKVKRKLQSSETAKPKIIGKTGRRRDACIAYEDRLLDSHDDLIKGGH